MTEPRRASSAGGDVVLGIDGQADVVQQGGQQEFLVVGADIARQVKNLQAVKEGVTLGVLLRVLLDLLERLEPHLVDRKPVEMFGERADECLRLGFRHLVSRLRGVWLGVAPERDQLLANLGVGGKVARPDAVAQDGRRLPLGAVEVAGAQGVKPIWRRFLARRKERLVNPAGGLEGDLLPQPA